MFKKITIRSSLLAIVAALAAVLAITVATSLHTMSDMKDDTTLLAQQVLPNVQMSNEIESELLRRHLRLNMHVNSTEASAMTQIEGDIRTSTSEIEAARTKLAPRLVLEKSKEALKRYEALVPTYRTGMEQVLELSRKGDKAAAGAQLRDLRPVLANMEKAVNELSGHIASRGETVIAAAESEYRNSLYLLIALAGLATLVSVGAILIVTRRVASPIVATTQAMNELAKGNLDTTIRHADREDEIGTMAKALEIFRESLVKVRALEEQERAAAARRLARAQSMEAVVSDVGEVVAAAAAGDFSARLQIDQADEQMQKLVAGINEINAVVDSATSEFARTLSAVAAGDLTVRVDAAYRGKFAELKGAINETVERLSSTVKTIQVTSADVGLAAREINMGADDLSKRTEEQASSLEETAATTEELAASVKASAQASREAASIADEAMKAAQTGGAIAGKAVDAMARIEDASTKISDIIRVIDD
ncbi:MAG: MCP four helix bundle domain-containing protein, partial [Beijerinckiaceae bacterium]|nr:MCP four helix bundle domain-containing protein [Beijerinckiaceae bacterium]